MMMHMFMATGRIKLIADDYIVLTSINTSGKEVALKIFISGNMMKNVKEYTTVGDMCGVKGCFDNSSEQKKIILVAERVTFLSKSGLVSDTEGEELEDE